VPLKSRLGVTQRLLEMAPFDKSRSSYSSSVATTFIANL